MEEFVRGTLRGRALRDLIAHLDSCPDCFDFYADVARAARPATRFPTVFPIRRSLLAAAAVLVLTIVGWWVFTRQEASKGATPTSIALLRSVDLERLASSVRDRPAWDGERAAAAEHLEGHQVAFRLGVTVVDLDVTLAAADDQQAIEVIEGQLRPLVGVVTQRGLIEPIYLEVLRGLRSGLPPPQLRHEATKAAETLDRWLEEAYRIGAWAEAGRLAAAAESREYFRSSAAREPPTNSETDLSPELQASLAETVASLHALDGNWQEADFQALENVFGRLVAEGGGRRPGNSR